MTNRDLDQAWKMDQVEDGDCFTEVWTHESGAIIGLSTNGKWEAAAAPGQPLVGTWVSATLAAAHALRGGAQNGALRGEPTLA